MTNSYQIEMKENVLVLKTNSFKVEPGSFLHSGIFNRELASSLAAGGIVSLLGFFFAVYSKIKIVHFLTAILLFAALFVILRLSIFREPILETVFDKNRKVITLSLKNAIGSKAQSFPLNELSGIRLNHVAVQPENVDGIKVVEKIALQHGTVIPGFGKIQNIFTVQLDIGDKKRTVFSTGERQAAEAVITELKGYLNGLLHGTVTGA